MHAAGSITVALIDDEHAIRKGLGLLIDGTPGYRCVGALGSVEEAPRSLGGEAPDALLFNEKPSMQIVMLTLHGEDDHIFESMYNGPSGCLLKRMVGVIRDCTSISRPNRCARPLSRIIF